MMNEEEQYLIHNLTAVASGQSQGKFLIGEHFAQVMLGLYESPPMHVEFCASPAFAKAVKDFIEDESELEYCTTVFNNLKAAARGGQEMGVGKTAALGLFALFDRDIREYAKDHG